MTSRSTVWIYLFSLPFQLVEEFKWHTIGGVGIAAFIYLGFIAAGEEIEQPFGKPSSSSYCVTD
jgi:putative membrane protein